MFGQFLCNMYRKIIFFLGVDYFDSLEFVYQYTGVAYLTTAFCMLRSTPIFSHNQKTPQSGDSKSQPSAAVVIWKGGATK